MNIRKPVFFLLLVMSVCRGEQIFDNDVVFNGSVSVPTSTVAAQAVNNTRLLSVSNDLQDAIDAIVSGATDWGDIGGTLADQTDLKSALDLKATLSALVTESGRIDTAEADIAVLETTTAKKNQSNVFLGGNDYFGASASTNGHVRLFTDATDAFVNINRQTSQDEALLGFFAGGSGVWTLGPRAYPARSPEPDAFLLNHSPTGASGYFFWVSTNGTVHAKTDFVAGGSIYGNGVGITNLVSSNLTGTIPAARLPEDASPNGNWSFSEVTADQFTGAGTGLTDLNASNLASGTIPAARLPDSNAAREALGLAIGTNVPAYVAPGAFYPHTGTNIVLDPAHDNWTGFAVVTADSTVSFGTWSTNQFAAYTLTLRNAGDHTITWPTASIDGTFSPSLDNRDTIEFWRQPGTNTWAWGQAE